MTQGLQFIWKEQNCTIEVKNALFRGMPPHPTLPLLARHELYEFGQDTGPHRHVDFYALYIIEGGHGLHVINGHPYTITRGDVYMLLPGFIHGYRDYQRLALRAFYFQSHLFTSQEQEALRALPGFWRLLLADEGSEAKDEFRNHRLHLSPERCNELEAILEEILSEFVRSAPEAVPLVHALFFRLLIYLARWQMAQPVVSPQPPGKAGSQRTSYTITDVLRFCEEHYHEPLNVPQLAELMFLSPGRFSELFTQQVGTSPASYIRRLRLERAQTLLRTTDIAVTKIAHEVGFSDGSQLSRAFHAMFSTSPSEYRSITRHTR